MKHILGIKFTELTSNPVRSGTMNSGIFFGTILKFPSNEREMLKSKDVSIVLIYKIKMSIFIKFSERLFKFSSFRNLTV